MPLTCQRCGAQNADHSKFCLSCGNDLRPMGGAPPAGPPGGGFGPPPAAPGGFGPPPAAGGGFGGFGGGGGGQNAASASALAKKRSKVLAVPDQRTSSVIVKAARDIMGQISQMIQQLDSDPARKQKVFVYQLDNADPSDVEQVLRSLFENSQNQNSSSRNSQTQTSALNTRATQQGQNNNRSSNTGFGGGGGGGGGGGAGGAAGR